MFFFSQLEVYQSDFQAERDARERQHADMLQLLKRNQQLEEDYQRQQDELDQHYNAQLTTMQLRHGEDHRSPHSQPPPMSTSYQAPEDVPGWMETLGGFFVRRGATGEPTGVPGVAAGEPRAEDYRGQSPSGEENQWSCPQCQQRFPDFDSLQIHAVECNGGQQQEHAPWCPMCQRFFPDMDTLNIHITECVN